MRRRVPVELPMTAIRTGEPSGRAARLLEARILACQEAEVRLLRTTEPDKRLYSLLDRLSLLRLAAEEIVAPSGLPSSARGNLTLF